MACNENVVKNMANEITRNCQVHSVVVDPEFVIYLIDLLLLNPKYGKLFSKTINRNNLQYFVEECVNMLTRGDTSINTLKMQFIIQTNYDKLQNLVDKHLESIATCLRPLVNEILDEEPALENEAECKKLFRKISIYIVLASGLGNPGVITTLKEGMAALESVFSLNDLKMFVALARSEKMEQLNELMEIVSGVRLFNRDCKKSGEGIPDLPFNLVDAGKACLASLSNSLITVMQRVNALTTGVEDSVGIHDETGNVHINIPPATNLELPHPAYDQAVPFYLVDAGKALLASLSNALITVMQRVNALTTGVEDTVGIHDETDNVHVDILPATDLELDDYKQIFQLLAFNRQYELIIRKLLADVELMVASAVTCVERARGVLEELHGAVRYKAAVPVVTVFPLFAKLWQVWRAMQNIMFLVSTVNRLMSTLASIQDTMKIPYNILDEMLRGRKVVTDHERMSAAVTIEERLSLGSLKNYVGCSDIGAHLKVKHVQFLGFCALCLSVGALVPSNMKVGLIKSKGERYGFCGVKMAARFSKDPERYVNEALDYARNNPHVINLLNIFEEVHRVREVDTLVTKYLPKIKVLDKDVQTEAHPVESYIEKNYSWDMWKWKRRACQWASIVNCQTHSTQTYYSHMRAEIQCQTVEPRDKCQQTKRDCGVNTPATNYFLWGLRGQRGYGQHVWDLTDRSVSQRKKALVISTCTWPCEDMTEAISETELAGSE